ncbi:hypothetical protein V6Z11_A06G130300 [Gossypium hirsutum]
MALSTINMQHSWKQWLAEDFMKSSLMVCRKLVISYWALWYNRNKVYHEGIRDQIQDVMGFINAYVLEIEQLSELSKSLDLPKQYVWEPSEGDTIKLNFDVSFNQQLQISYLGIVA